MIQKKYVFIVFLAILFLVLSFEITPKKKTLKQVENKIYSNNDVHYAYSSDKKLYGNMEKVKQSEYIEEKTYGGILSHHFFVAKYIGGFFEKIRKQKIKTFVILGPNHFNAGASDVLVSKYPYDTPWGMLEPEKEVINNLIESGIAKNDEQVFEREHSISALVGFVKYYFPDAEIVPIIIKRGTSPEKAERLAEKLNQILAEDSMVLASVDFSHHLNKTSAEFHDQTSISAIKNFDFDRIYNLEIDSPPSIYALMKYLEKRNARKMKYENTNSATFSKDDKSQDVTSYLFSYFLKGSREKTKDVSVLSFGDMMFDRKIKEMIGDNKNPFENILGREGNFLKGVDFISANLEGPITTEIDCAKKEVNFKFPKETASLLRKSKINIVNLANNHLFDCGSEGYTDTKNSLDKSKIGYFGGGDLQDSYIIENANNVKTVFMGIDATLDRINLEKYYSLVKELKKNNDYVVVNVHWGFEYSQSVSLEQTNIARNLIDSGADVVIGHHPHIVQRIELYKDKTIFYSLGNFIFDQELNEANIGVGVGFALSENKNKFYLFPYRIENYKPTLFGFDEMKEFCDNMLKDVANRELCYFEN